MHALRVRRIGKLLGVTLPKTVLNPLRASEGDTVYLTETPNRHELTPYDEDLTRGMEPFEETRRKYRNALRELAK